MTDKDLGKLQQFKGVMVACSGGLDSTLMLRNLWRISENQIKFKISVIHVNFHLRAEESDGDELFISNICDELGLKFNRFDAPKKEDVGAGESTQEWARRVRYEIFETKIEDGWAVGLAHHANDLAENVLFRLARGSFPENLLGMKRWDGAYFRPMLEIPRRSIEEYGARHNVHYRHDSSNDKLDYSRNRIRKIVLEELEGIAPGATQRIIQTAKEAGIHANLAKDNLATKSPNLSSPEALRLYIEKESEDPISMKKAEWGELSNWFNNSQNGASFVCSVGILSNKDGKPSFIKGHPLQAEDSKKAELGFEKSIIISRGSTYKFSGLTESSIKIAFKNDGIIEKSQIRVSLVSFHKRKAYLKGKGLGTVERISNKNLILSQVEKDSAYILIINNEECVFFSQDKMYDLTDQMVEATSKFTYKKSIKVIYE